MTSGTEAPRDGGGELSAWIGRERRTSDLITLERARKLSATLDRDPGHLGAGAPLPPAWHWIYFHEPVRRSELADDGHERRGSFLPPVPLPRRMWAGGRLTFHRPLRLGDRVTRVSTIRSIEEKRGRIGPLVFVTVGHHMTDEDGVAVEEEQDLVYLGPPDDPEGRDESTPRKGTGAPDVDDAQERLAFSADEVTLFRFSALTFNGHRIHYDHPYATGVEGYPDLVVHGPLLALALVGAGARWTRPPEGDDLTGWRFDYRARGPAFCRETVELRGVRRRGDAGGGMELSVVHPRRGPLMTATLAPIGPDRSSRPPIPGTPPSP